MGNHVPVALGIIFAERGNKSMDVTALVTVVGCKHQHPRERSERSSRTVRLEAELSVFFAEVR